MKKTLLLSVVASTMIMAGGDIAPVEPVVEAPAATPVAASDWKFNGQAVVYYQTRDNKDDDLFAQETATADAGIKLRATNENVFSGVGAGVEVNGLSTLNLENSMVSNVMQGVGNAAALGNGNDIDDVSDGGWISQAYLTYGVGNTSLKLGRQELPKALSPFAFSEGWNVFKNTFDAVLAVNTDLADTTLVGAWVAGANKNGFGAGNNLTDFNSLNDKDGVYMLTAQNKSVEGLTLTGSWYYGKDMAVTDDINILWGDAKFAVAGLNIGLQGGSVMSDAFGDDTVAYGAKVGGTFSGISASLAYSSVDDGDAGVFNVGGVKTPLYTQMILNQKAIKSDNDTFVARVGTAALGGKIGLAVDFTKNNAAGGEDYTEADLTYKTKVFNDTTTLFAGYVYTQQDGVNNDDAQNMIRVWGRYNF